MPTTVGGDEREHLGQLSSCSQQQFQDLGEHQSLMFLGVAVSFFFSSNMWYDFFFLHYHNTLIYESGW